MYNWRQVENKVFLDYKGGEIYFDMPKDWKLKDVHPTLLKLVEYILFHPYDKETFKVDNVSKWKQREGGDKYALAFSGGADSTAAMLLMGEDTILCYHKRGTYLGGQMRQDNALRMIEKMERKVHIIDSDNEKIRISYGSRAGYSCDFACMAGLILLADYFNLGTVATGTMLGSTYVKKGNIYRNFDESDYWKRWNILFSKAGLKIAFPVSGCSEVITNKLVQESKYKDLSYSCVRGQRGKHCNICYKCFRKNLLNGKISEITIEVKNILAKEPLHQGDSMIYAMNKKGLNIKGLEKYKNLKLDWIERYYTPALAVVPEEMRDSIIVRLIELGIKPMTSIDIIKMKRFKL